MVLGPRIRIPASTRRLDKGLFHLPPGGARFTETRRDEQHVPDAFCLELGNQIGNMGRGECDDAQIDGTRNIGNPFADLAAGNILPFWIDEVKFPPRIHRQQRWSEACCPTCRAVPDAPMNAIDRGEKRFPISFGATEGRRMPSDGRVPTIIRASTAVTRPSASMTRGLISTSVMSLQSAAS